MNAFSDARVVLERAVGSAFPAAVTEVGSCDQALWHEAFGRLSYEEDARSTTTETIFDLASLTKVIATATVAMHLVETGRLSLDDRVGRWLSDWAGTDREMVTVRDLLTHTAGLTGYLSFYRDHSGRREFERAICTMALEYAPRTQSIYSDLGFILLGFILEEAGGAPFATQFREIAGALTNDPLDFTPPRAWQRRTAPTEIDAWRGRLLVGEVHDENAWALGGVAGHAGLFGTAAAVGRFARCVLATLTRPTLLGRPETLRIFLARSSLPGSSRALAWDTMLPASSCGSYMSPSAVGHTGFTGTSLWIDPAADRYVVLLTNRVHPTRDNDAIRQVRRDFHDAVMKP